jgi:hypothetical protein
VEADEQVSGRSSHELLRHSPLEPEIPALLDKMTSRRAQAAGHSGIAVLHGSGKVHEEEQRDVDRYAETAVGEANAGRLNELGRRGLVRVVPHKKSPSGGRAKLARDHPSIH